jgi:TonB-linked SusC/RagA family outer membrane protein
MQKTAYGGWKILPDGGRFRAPAQMLRIMRMLFFLLFVALLSAHAEGTAQKVTLPGERLTLKQVFSVIEQQTGYVMLGSEDVFTSRKAVSLRVVNMPLQELLDTMLKDFSLKYVIQDKTIIVSRNPPRKNDLSPPFDFAAAPAPPITGRVLGVGGQPLEGASVKFKNKRGGMATNQKGEFSIDALPGDILVVSYTGYETKEYKIADGNQVVITLALQDNQQAEVVVNTGMFRKSNASFTGASTTVTAKELALFGNRNLLTSLRNIDPAFNIIANNSFGSDPNRLPEIQVRGNSSIPNVNELQDQVRVGLNTPLIIVDGIESTLQRMYDMNENEVETITLLKDASATAMYGSRGANGVVVIVTRSPQMGKLRMSFRSDVNVEVPDVSDYNLMNARDKLQLEVLAGYYNSKYPGDDINLKRYYNYLLNEVNRGVETDWLAIPLRNGVGQRHNLRIEGGDKQFRYSASAQYNAIEGAMKGSSHRTFNGNITLDYTYDKLRIRNSLQIMQGNNNESPYGSFADYTRLNAYWTPYDSLGKVTKFLGTPDYASSTPYWAGGLPANPLYNATLHTINKTAITEIYNTAVVEYKIVPGMLARVQLGLNKRVSQSDRFRPADHTAFANLTGNNVFRKGDYLYGVGNNMKYDASLNLQYTRAIAEKHIISAGADYNVRQIKSSDYSFLAEGFPRANLDFISMGLQYAANSKPGGSEGLTRAIGATATFNYSYDGRYFMDASYRVDGASQFGSNKKFAPFWSTGVGWNVDREKFFADHFRKIDRLKIRGSVGVTGSQNFDAYQSLSTYQYYTDDRYFAWMGSYLKGLGNPNLKWQQQIQYNIGMDAGLLKSRLNLTFNYYTRHTDGLISSVTLPMSSGFPSYVENIGSLRNTGFEIRATGILINRNGFMWTVTGSALQNRNKILTTSQALKTAQNAILGSVSDPGTLYMEGYSSNTIWVVPSLGIDPSTGKEVFLGKDGKPTSTWKASDIVAAGNRDPDLRGNFSTLLRYKEFTINVSFGYNYGGQQYNQTFASKVELTNYRYNVDRRVYDNRWQKPGDIAAFKGILETAPTYKTSRFVQDDNTLVLQNVDFQYNISNRAFLRKIHMQSFAITANAAEPLYLSSIRRERGTDYPFARQYSFSLNMTF